MRRLPVPLPLGRQLLAPEELALAVKALYIEASTLSNSFSFSLSFLASILTLGVETDLVLSSYPICFMIVSACL